MLPRPIHVRFGALACALALAALPARADVTHAAWIDQNNFNFKLNHMPDFDQRRKSGGGAFGLPNEGNQYCVPTAAINVMAYIANHGFPQLSPGPGAWQSQTKYTEAGLAIHQMGQFMSTDPNSGTGGEGWSDGLQSWLYGTDAFTVSQYWAHDNYSPRLKDLAASALNGGLVQLAYGRYQVTGSWNGFPLIDRDGGHSITLTRAAAGGGVSALWARDPAAPNDGNLTDQSTFASKTFVVVEKAVTTGPSFGKIKTMATLNYDAQKAKNAYLDQYSSIRPKTGYSFTNTGSDPNILVYNPAALVGHLTPPKKSIPFPHQAAVKNALLGPDQNHVFVLSDPVGVSSDTIHKVDVLSGATKPVAAIPGATHLVFGRDRKLYVLANQLQLHCIDVDLDVPTVVTKQIPFLCDDLAYDDLTDEVIVLSTLGKAVFRYPKNLAGNYAFVPFPVWLPATILPTFALDPNDGTLWTIDPATNTLRGFDAIPGVPSHSDLVNLPAVQGATAVDVDDQGKLLVTTPTGVVELVKPVGAGWQTKPNSLWSGLPGGERFRISRSRTNFDPATMSGPKFRHLSPDDLVGLADGPELVDCTNDASDVVYGNGKAGTFGVPKLTPTGYPAIGAEAGIRLSNALPGAFPILFLGVNAANVPFDGGALLVKPSVVWALPVPVPANGVLDISLTLPLDASFCGVTLYHQFMYVDPGATGFHHSAQTNGLRRYFGS